MGLLPEEARSDSELIFISFLYFPASHRSQNRHKNLRKAQKENFLQGIVS